MENNFLEKRYALHKINWNFENADTQYSLHRFHWYPATFIPQIPAYLIEFFSKPGEVIYDPFCGVGTTLVEALRLGRKAIGVDVNYIACMIARSKITLFEANVIENYCKNFLKRLPWTECKERGFNSLWSFPYRRELRILEEEYRDLGCWYHEKTFQELLLLWYLINEEEGSFRTLLYVVFSRILKTCSSQHEHWGYVADNMLPRKKYYRDAMSLFTNSLNECKDALLSFLEFPILNSCNIDELNRRACVVRTDLKNGSPVKTGTIDLIVTSPPYANVSDYTTSQRLSLYWFKQDVDSLKKHEIGARWKRFRKKAIEQYFTEMDLCLNHISVTLKPGKLLCMVLGESDERREKFGIVGGLKDIVKQKGFRIFPEEITRVRSRQRVISRTGSSGREHILIFQKY